MPAAQQDVRIRAFFFFSLLLLPTGNETVPRQLVPYVAQMDLYRVAAGNFWDNTIWFFKLVFYVSGNR
jgi:hypothetical protein